MRLLITGACSYIGSHLEALLKRYPGKYEVEALDLLDPDWAGFNFAGFDAVFHVAAIVHDRKGHAEEQLYQRVNVDLPVQVASRAKASGVRQFILMSSIKVYGTLPRGEFIIRQDTLPSPDTVYGRSKLQAERLLRALEEDSFCVATVRAPMVYGPACRGNYALMRRIVHTFPFFPALHTQRSFIYVSHLAEFIRLVLESGRGGVFFPQDREHADICTMAQAIAGAGGRSLRLSPFLGAVCRLLRAIHFPLVRKAFESLAYDLSLSAHFGWAYCTHTQQECIAETEHLWPAS
jgi:nucleoside-diphosphate-sugar epimerase